MRRRVCAICGQRLADGQRVLESLHSLVLVAGTGPATLPTNNYGFSGTYFDMKGPNGVSEDVAHPGGGPVAFLYVFSNNGGISTYFDSQAGPYDGADDTQVGVLNNSSQTLLSFKVTSNQAVFAFDGDARMNPTQPAQPGPANDAHQHGLRLIIERMPGRYFI